ncbi:hypothetical protein GR268_47345, partial [Rhizobium leguminosarum]|nr:hypothetical protein [Rhizobium leguminosarum]
MVKRFAQMCTLELNSVCGCNDQTYSNPCLAFSSGVSIRSFGECQGVCRVSCAVCRVSCVVCREGELTRHTQH